MQRIDAVPYCFIRNRSGRSTVLLFSKSVVILRLCPLNGITRKRAQSDQTIVPNVQKRTTLFTFNHLTSKQLYYGALTSSHVVRQLLTYSECCLHPYASVDASVA